MRHSLTTALATIFLAAGLASCGASGDGSQGTAVEPSADLNAKIRPFVGCANKIDSALETTAEKYRKDFAKLSANPTYGDLRDFSSFNEGIYDTNNKSMRECIAGIRKAISQAPKDAELDRLGRDYAATLEKLIPLMNSADTYYGQEDYRDDKMAKGRALDQQLSPLLTRLSELSRKLAKVIDARQAGLAESRLQQIEKTQGKAFAWQTENVMLQAKRSIDMIEAGVKDGKVDPKVVTAAEALMQKAYDDAVAYGETHADVKTPGGNQPMWFYLRGSANNYLGAIKALRRAAESKQADLSRESDELVRSFNGLIENYNLRAPLDR